MSKIRLGWLWIVVALEVIAIAALLVWAFVFRTPKTQPPTETPKVGQQNPAQTYKTPKIELKKILEGFKEPVAIVAASTDASDKQLYIVEQAGVIRVAPSDGSTKPDVFLDITSKVQSGGELGLLGLAFHQKLNEQPYFYVNYTDKNQNTIVARYTLKKEAEKWSAVASSEKIILKVKQPYANHNGGALAFGPDGYLYIGMGDGGSGGDPENHAQNNNDLLGKMLRIDVDNGIAYAIPDDNPFVKEGGKPEIWASGLRNPWRFSFDRKTGDMYIADVGQGTWEEINFQPATSKGSVVNYGWRCYEGAHEFKTQGCQDASAYTKPIIEYDHADSRCSVTGGYVYRGSAFPALAGKYFYGDFCGGQLYYAEQVAGQWKSTTATKTTYQPSTFGEDGAGELYMADYTTGAIYQLTDTAN